MTYKTRLLLWLCLVTVIVLTLVLAFALCKVAGEADEQLSHGTHVARKTSPKPIRTWVRYAVPLDDKLQQFIEEACKEYNVPVSLVLAIIKRESHFDPDHIGDDGESFGLMQVYATEHTDRCIRLGAYNLLNPYQNVVVGVDYLSELLNEGKGTEWALMAYNGGYGYADARVAENIVSSYTIDVLEMAEEIEKNKVVVEVY